MDEAADVFMDPALAGMREAMLAQGQRRPPMRVSLPEEAARMREAKLKRLPEDRPLSIRWQTIMTMQMRGLKASEIADRLSLSVNTIHNITHTEKYRKHFARRLEGLDDELLSLKPRAIEALGAALAANNPDTGLRAAAEFFKVTGQGTYGKTAAAPEGTTTAESLARALLIASKQEVHIHVGSAPSTSGYAEAGGGRGGVQALDDGTREGVYSDQARGQGGAGTHPRSDDREPHRVEADAGREPSGQCDDPPLGGPSADRHPPLAPRLSRDASLRETLA